MTYARFEDLTVCKEAIRLANGVYDMTESKSWKGSRSLRDQIERAALSVSSNTAEGFERGTTNELFPSVAWMGGSSSKFRNQGPTPLNRTVKAAVSFSERCRGI